MNIIQVIGELYRSDIDCGLESYRGFGVTAWIVDEHNRRIERHFEANELDAISEWLQVEAARQHSFAYDLARGAVAHYLLAELADSPRKAPKQVTHRDREERSQVAKVPAGG
jgi:hypothetical protein